MILWWENFGDGGKKGLGKLCQQLAICPLKCPTPHISDKSFSLKFSKTTEVEILIEINRVTKL